LFGRIEAAAPDQFVDLTVTSGPYNIGKEYEKFLVLDEYLNWCEQWIAEVYRVTIEERFGCI
jgi:DNA modification methylase